MCELTGLFHKIFGGDVDLLSGTIFGPCRGRSGTHVGDGVRWGGLTLGMESDDVGLGKVVH